MDDTPRPPRPPCVPHRLPSHPPSDIGESSDEEPAGLAVAVPVPRAPRAFASLTAVRAARAPVPPLIFRRADGGRSVTPGNTWAFCVLLKTFLALHVVLVMPCSLESSGSKNEWQDKRQPEVLLAEWATKQLEKYNTGSGSGPDVRVTFITDNQSAVLRA